MPSEALSMSLAITLFDGPKDNAPKCGFVRWVDLAAELMVHEERAEKGGRAWSATRYRKGATRGNDGVEALSCAVFDLEGPKHTPLPSDRVDALWIIIDAARIECVVYSTFSGIGFYRAVFPLAREITPGEWPRVRAGLIERLGLPADPQTTDVARLYYLPECAVGTTPYAQRFGGEWVDPDAIIPVRAAPTPASTAHAAPTSASTAPVDTAPLRAAIKGARGAVAKVLGRVSEGKALADVGERDSTVNRVASHLAFAESASLESAIALVEPSIRAMECAPEGPEHWLEVFRKCYLRAATRKAAEDKKREATLEVLDKALRPSGPKSDGSGGADDWKSELFVRTNARGDAMGLEHITANIVTILEHDERFAGKLHLDMVTRTGVITGGPLRDLSPNSIGTEIACILACAPYSLRVTGLQCTDALAAVMWRHQVDPLRAYLQGLTWDGDDRVCDFFGRYFSAADTDYMRAISRRWLISCAARALQPGCKVDTVMVLQGQQGAYKSQALDILACPWFSDTRIEIGSKDSRISATKRWIIEMPELDAWSRSDARAMKAFFSQRGDFVRPPYGRAEEEFLRRCVFVGSTNDAEFLSDETGARRYWPISVGEIDLEALRRDRDQIWAQAVAMYTAGEQWWLTPLEAPAQVLEAELRTESVPYSDSIRDWILSIPALARPEYVRTAQVAAALGIPIERLNRAMEMAIGRALRALGFSRGKSMMAGSLVNVYRLPLSLISQRGIVDARPALEVVK